MSKIRRTNQGGSAIIFVIVGIILAIGLIGSVYFVVQRGEVVRKEQAIATYDKDQADKKVAEKADKPEVVNTSDTASSDVNSAETSIPTTDLPVTGPELILSNLLGVGLLTIAIASYLMSRRNQVRSL